MKTTALPLAFLLTGLSGSAYADQAPPDAGAPLPTECQTNDDCDAGFACEVTGGEGCACAPDQSCDCPIIEYRSCVPGPCQTDADCGGDLVCITYEVGCATSVPDCAPGSDCGNFAPPPCESETRSVCAPKWVRPCETAADCGDGFTCEETESCTCSGGGATPSEPADPANPSDPSGVPFVPPPDESCTCEPSGQKACQLVEVACDDDSGCAAGWTCERYATDVGCTEPASGGGSDPGSSGSGDSDAGAPREETPCDAFAPPAEPAQGVCVPPYAHSYGGGWANDGSTGTPREETSNPQDPGTTPADPTPTGEGVPGTTATGGACSGSGPGSLLGLALAVLALGLARRRAA